MLELNRYIHTVHSSGSLLFLSVFSESYAWAVAIGCYPGWTAIAGLIFSFDS